MPELLIFPAFFFGKLFLMLEGGFPFGFQEILASGCLDFDECMVVYGMLR